MSLLKGTTFLSASESVKGKKFDRYEKLLRSKLSSHLHADEVLKYYCQGNMKSSDCIVFLTNHRVVFFYYKDSKVKSIKHIQYSQVKEVEAKVGLLTGLITIDTKQGLFVLKNTHKESSFNFRDMASKLMKKSLTEMELSYTKTYVTEVMTKLEFLRDQEIISEEDFLAQKAELFTV